MITSAIINGHEWYFATFHKNIEYDIYTSMFTSSDGDVPELYVRKDKSGFDLCDIFIGVTGSSEFKVDEISFPSFNHIKSFKEAGYEIDFTAPFHIQCLTIADYILSRFCEYHK